ncbi:hypothetical protein [Bradyrhizobium sp. F1.13.3]|uniref:hypothetical protein n=1 Tax=Bradyrhizobium sp. F1.13.3 TaxID=3156351 RepID=UPI0033949DC3
MRAISIVAVALIVPASVLAQEKEKPSDPPPCSYSLMTGQYVEVPVGSTVCRRAPAPYQDLYGLLQCIPPLNEVEQVKRGDPRCEKYDDRP